jgi:hypothetical protein
MGDWSVVSGQSSVVRCPWLVESPGLGTGFLPSSPTRHITDDNTGIFFHETARDIRNDLRWLLTTANGQLTTDHGQRTTDLPSDFDHTCHPNGRNGADLREDFIGDVIINLNQPHG